MKKRSRWVKCRMTCPEGKGKGHLFVQWQTEGGKEVVNSIRCDNVYLTDFAGGDCQWSCWDKVSQEELA
jgi:hypothetical protein